MQVKQDHQVSSPYLMIMLMIVVSVAVLGIIAIANGYVPFSPSFFISYPLSAATCYLSVLGMCYRFEVSESPYSVRPYLSEDPQSFFNIYLLVCTVWALGLIPVFWMRMGQFALLGASVDQMIYQNRYLCLMVGLVGVFTYFLRRKAIEQKDIYRVNRQSPMIQESALHVDIPPGWSHSDVWEAVSVTEREIQVVSDRDRSHYEKRREEKLKKDTHEVEAFRTNSIEEFLMGHQTQSQNLKTDSSFEQGSEDPTHHSEIEDASILPSWLSQDGGKSTYDYAQSSIRRSVGDFDTRFEPTVIPAHEVLADNISWSGIRRPARRPRRSSSSQMDLMHQDSSDYPTSPPLALNAEQDSGSPKRTRNKEFNLLDSDTTKQKNSEAQELQNSGFGEQDKLSTESLEDQMILEQVLEVISDTHIHIDRYESEVKPEALQRISFNSLEALQENNHTHVAFGAIDPD